MIEEALRREDVLGTTHSPSELATINRERRRRSNQTRFLRCFSVCGQVGEAARRARIHRDTHYAWLEDDPQYKAKFRALVPQVVRMLEDEAIRRAHQGMSTPVLHKGKQVYVKQVFDAPP